MMARRGLALPGVVSRAAGFTLIELLVVLVLMAALMLVTMPLIRSMLERAKMVGAAEQVAGVFRLARLEAIKNNVVTVVQFNYGNDSLMAYADVNNATGTPGSGSDLVYDPPAAAQSSTILVRNYDYVITTIYLPTKVHFWGAPDNSPYGLSTVLGFSVNPKGGPNLAVFNPDGSIAATGQVRIGDGTFPRTIAAASDTQDNFLAIVVQPQATARVFLTKYNPTVTLGDATKYFEPGTDPTTHQPLWVWY